MSSVDERLASLEARMDGMADLRPLITDLRGEMSQQFGAFRGEMNQLRGDMNRQFGDLRGEMNQRFAEMNHRINTLDAKSDRHFTWLVGIQVASMLAVVGALVGAYYR